MSQAPYDPYDPGHQTLEINNDRASNQYEPYMDSPAHPTAASGWGQYPPPPPSPGLRNSVQASSIEERMPLKNANEGSPLATGGAAAGARSNRKWIWIGVIAAIIIIALAVVLPVYFVVIRKDSADTGGGSSDGSTGGDKPPGNDGSGNNGGNSPPPMNEPEPPQGAISGGDGSEIMRGDGTTFVYKNAFGGTWYHDPTDPFNLNAQAQSYTPPLNTTWRFGVDKVYGVNLGGAFVLEPFITPHFFQKYPGTEDEYQLVEAMRAAGNIAELEEHYATFITEDDIAEIAGAGLNWLRIPLGFWAIETYDNEPFLEGSSWRHFLKVVEWARKYGLRVVLDLHAVPGGQNGLNHSARNDHFSFMNGPMGLANAQRFLYYLRVVTEFLSQPEYRAVVPMLGLVNEPRVRGDTIGAWRSFYLEAYRVIREVSGFGEGNGPYIVIGDGFLGANIWGGVMPGADRFAMDLHPYMAFDLEYEIRQDLLTDVAEDGQLGGTYPRMACDRWGTYFGDARRNIGVTFGGEFSAAVNDCGLFMRGVGLTNDNPDCAVYNNWETWTTEFKTGLMNYALASYDAIGDFFFWTWKIGPSEAGRVETPMWSYKLGLDNGWIPRDPRAAVGKCRALAAPVLAHDGVFQPHQTGALTQPTVDPIYASNNPWPPLEIPSAGVPVSLMPTYTTAGAPLTLPVHTFTGAPAERTQSVDGWFGEGVPAPGVTPIPGCSYPDQYTVTALVPVPTGPWCAAA